MGFIIMQNASAAPNGLGGIAMWTNNNVSSGSTGNDPSDAPTNLRINQFVPFDTTLKSLLWRTTAAPGSGKTENIRVHKNGGSNVSNIMQITGASSQEGGGVIEEDLEGLDSTSSATILASIFYATLWPSTAGNAVGSGYAAFEYQDIAHPGYQWQNCGASSTILTASFAAANQYSAICDSTISSAQTNQQVRQIRMPIAGTIKYIWAVWSGYSATTTVEAAIQTGTLGAGTDDMTPFNMTGTTPTTDYQGMLDTSTEIAIAEGDYVNWRFKRTAGAATAGQITVGFGFAPGVF